MNYKGKEADIELFIGDTPKEAQEALKVGSLSRNILDIRMNSTTDNKFCLTVIFENKEVARQLLMEG